MMDYHQRIYGKNVTEEDFKISILLNNAFNNLNKENSELAFENIKEIRSELGKKQKNNFNYS